MNTSSLPEGVRRFLSGAVSGTLTAAVLQPFDVVRTMQQGLAAQGHGAGRSPIVVARQLVHSEGAGALWKGLGPTITRVFFGAGIYFASINAIKTALEASPPPPPPAEPVPGALYRRGSTAAPLAGAAASPSPSSSSSSVASKSGRSIDAFVTGALARCVAATIMSPVAVVKTRAEFAPRHANPFASTVPGVLHILRTEGMGPLYAGLLPTILRDAPFSGIYFTAYSHLSKALDSDGFHAVLPAPAARNFVAGLAAGAVATLVTQPADLIRTRLQLTVGADSSLLGAGSHIGRVAREVWVSQGARGLFLGGTARVLKRAISTAITWTLFEEAMRRSGGGGGG